VNRGEARFGIHSVSPNPATEQISVAFVALAEEMLLLRVVDATGKLVQQQTIPAKPGLNSVLLPVRQLPAGIYNLLLSNERQVAAPWRVVKE